MFSPRPTHLAQGAAFLVTGLLSLAAVQGAPAKLAAKAPLSAKGAAPAQPDGQQVYAQRCASCHGAKGEGSKAYAKALTGDRSVGQLAAYIAKNMPPGPKKCTGPNAQQVAAYIHEAFYSPLAQARNKPARVELSRLTVRQYRNAITDLIGSFRNGPQPVAERGLHAEYFKSRRMGGEDRVLERNDSEVHFDWGKNAPGPNPDQFELHTFSARWTGSVIAPDTGEYEFVIHTDQATRLWLNDMRKPLIDAWVKSGSDNEFRGSIYLLGGRRYPLRLEFTKATSGVDDTAKLKDKPITNASMSFEWRAPKRALEVVPVRCLMPQNGPELFSVSAAFPPDDRSLGYERGTSVSKAWEEATTEGALETAGYVVGKLRELSGVAEDAPDRPAKLREFCTRFTTRAFRRPLTPELLRTYVEHPFQTAPDPETAVKRCVLMALKSPRFLYRELDSGAAPDAYDAASRLSFGLWDSVPDAELLKAAAAGELTTPEQVRKQAERMVNDPRARSKAREFFLQWLKVDQYPDLAKDAKRFPGFDQGVAGDLRASFELTLDSIVWSEKSDYRELLTGDKVYLNGRLAKLYGVNLPADAPFQAVSLEPGERAGVLTHPYLLSSFAYIDSSSPIHRGVLIARNMLGRVLQPPPQAFTPLPVDAHPNITTRERVSLQTKPAACAGCHNMINPLGFTLEKFDAIGRLRTLENGHPVDATGTYQPVHGSLVKFAGVRDLARYVAESEESQTAFVEKLFQFLVKQPVRAYGQDAPASLRRAFDEHGCSIREQMVESVTLAALYRPSTK